MSNIRVNTINDASGGSAAVLYGVASPPNSMGFRNRIINGDMRIDQRNGGASVTPANLQYTVDRWQTQLTQASKFSVQQNAGAVTPPLGFTNYLGVTSLSAYSVASGDFFSVQQVIEGFNASDLGWGTATAQSVTLSFLVRSSLTGTFGGAFSNSAFNRSYPFSYTISSANTWTTVSVTIPGDTSGTWLNTNGAGIYIRFGLGAGSTYSGAAGAWVASGLISATGATSVVGTNGATFYITGVQLEAGTVASPFERRDYGRELMMCQRYYQTGGLYYLAYAAAGNGFGYGVLFPVVMRASPAITYSNTVYLNASGISVGSSINANGFSTTAAATAAAAARFVTDFTASAEL